MAPPSRLISGGVMPPGLPRALAPSDGETASPTRGGIVPPGCTADLPYALPRSNGDGKRPAGAAVAPGAIRPGLPRGPGNTGCWAPPTAGLPPTAAAPPGRAAARVGGGIFFGFSVLIFCSSCALSGTPFQPCSIFGCATLVFTAGGATLGGALASLGGAATMSLLPCTLVSAPDLAAADKSAVVSR